MTKTAKKYNTKTRSVKKAQKQTEKQPKTKTFVIDGKKYKEFLVK